MHPNSTDKRIRARLARRCLRVGAASLLVLQCPTTALAHDTWFASRTSAPPPGNLVLALSTGNQFPLQEFPIAAEYVQTRGCRQSGRELPLSPVANTTTALVLHARAPLAGPVTCWAQLLPFEVKLEADKIGLYLDEINASPALRQTWDAMHARGVTWTERYVKNARIEIAGGAAPAVAGDAIVQSLTVPLAMDVVLDGGLQTRRAGAPLVFQVLRNGQPLPGFAIELRGSAADQASWLRTDAQGRVATVMPSAGNWVLRGTDLRLSKANPDVWESDFINLAFDVH